MHSFFLLYIRLELDAKNTFFFLPSFCFKDKNVEIKLMRCEVTCIILGVVLVLHNNKKYLM